jgi:hypothetical protein
MCDQDLSALELASAAEGESQLLRDEPATRYWTSHLELLTSVEHAETPQSLRVNDPETSNVTLVLRHCEGGRSVVTP